MIFLGILSIGFGLYVLMAIEGINAGLFLAPSALGIIVFCSLGGVLITYRPKEIISGLKAFFRKDIQDSREKLIDYANLFSLFSRYSMNAAWLGTVFGVINILRRIGQALESRDHINIGMLAGGIALGVVGILWGILLSKFVFESIKNNLERKALAAKEAGQGEAIPESVPCRWGKPVLLSLLAIVVVVLSLRAFMKARSMNSGAPQSQGASNTRRSTILETQLLGTSENPDIDITITDRGELHRLHCTIYVGYSREYESRGQFYDELKERIPQLRELVIRILGAKTLEDLQIRNLTPLKEEMIVRINELLSNGQIADIVFSNYVLDPMRPAVPPQSR